MNFTEMLDDVYNQLGSTTQTNFVLPEPIIEKTTTRILWKNIKAFLKITKTSPDHLFDFLRYQIDKNIDIAWYSESVSDGLIIHNIKKINSDQIMSLMRKYLITYVICSICKKTNTTMVKDSTIRKWTIKCSDCNSNYTV